MSDPTPTPHEPTSPTAPQPTTQPTTQQPTTDPPVPGRPGWRSRRVSLVAAAATLVAGSLLGAGAAVAAMAVTDGDHGGDGGREHSGDRHVDGRHGDDRNGS